MNQALERDAGPQAHTDMARKLLGRSKFSGLNFQSFQCSEPVPRLSQNGLSQNGLSQKGLGSRVSPKIRGTIVGGPHNKDYSKLGSIVGSPYLEKLPFRVLGLGVYMGVRV